MKIRRFVLLCILSALLVACDDTNKDLERPHIDLTMVGTFPVNCALLQRGKSFQFQFRLSDNYRLGSYSIEMHHNFDQHTHSTSPSQCVKDPIKRAVQPFLFIRDFSIAAGVKEYMATGTIAIPADIDIGDYHFMIRVTDATGWQSFEGISVKIVE